MRVAQFQHFRMREKWMIATDSKNDLTLSSGSKTSAVLSHSMDYNKLMSNPEVADEFHQHTVKFLEPAGFFAEAQDFLAEYADEVTASVIPQLTKREGRWHPLGFAVFPLMVREDGSSVRLHVWPKGLRKAQLENAIHDHAWHIISKVLSKEPYQDTRYDIQVVGDAPSTEDGRRKRNLHRVFRAHYPPGPQELRTDGTFARVTPIREVVVPSGQHNRIIAGEYHLDKIPIGRTVITLCLDSPKLITDGPHVIVDGPADTVGIARRSIPPEDLEVLQNVVQRAVA